MYNTAQDTEGATHLLLRTQRFTFCDRSKQALSDSGGRVFCQEWVLQGWPASQGAQTFSGQPVAQPANLGALWCLVLFTLCLA